MIKKASTINKGIKKATIKYKKRAPNIII